MDADALAGFELFAGFDQDALDRCAALFTEHRVLMGDHLTEKDDFGYSFFLVLDGEVKVTIDGNEVARLGPGDHFGEMALVRGDRRNAQVTATGAGRLAKMMAWDFNALTESHPVLAERLQAKAAERDS